MGKTVSVKTLVGKRKVLKRRRKTVVFTNGTFDILHRGHVEYLSKAKHLGDVLIVGLNTDASIRRIKGRGRPVNNGKDRAAVLSALEVVDYVCFFKEDTPLRLIEQIKPDVLVKGADWKLGDIVGNEVVKSGGGRVRRVRLTPGRSTTRMISRIQQLDTRTGRRQRKAST